MQAIQANSFNGPADTAVLGNSAPPGIVCSGDLGEEVAALEVENGEVERHMANEERATEEAAEARADAAQVQAMHDEASSLRSQGVFDGVVSLASAGLKAYCPAASAVADAGEKVGDAFWQAAEHDLEATAAAQKATADQAANAAKTASGAGDDAGSVIAAALEFDRTYVSTEAQVQLAALHRV